MKRYVSDTKAGKSIHCYLIMPLKGKESIGKILVHHGTGTTFCNIWIKDYVTSNYVIDLSAYLLFGYSSGYGFNRENAAISNAINQIAFKLLKSYNKELQRYDTKKFNVSIEDLQAIDSIGAKKLEDIFKALKVAILLACDVLKCPKNAIVKIKIEEL